MTQFQLITMYTWYFILSYRHRKKYLFIFKVVFAQKCQNVMSVWCFHVCVVIKTGLEIHDSIEQTWYFDILGEKLLKDDKIWTWKLLKKVHLADTFYVSKATLNNVSPLYDSIKSTWYYHKYAFLPWLIRRYFIPVDVLADLFITSCN